MKEGKINRYRVPLRFNLVHALTLFGCTAAFFFSATFHHSSYIDFFMCFNIFYIFFFKRYIELYKLHDKCAIKNLNNL